MTEAGVSAEAIEPPPPTVWAAVKEAVQGRYLEVALESVFAVVNVFRVGRLGPGAVATVGLTEAMFSCIYALGMGLGIGATAMVARRIGEKNPEGAARAAVLGNGQWLSIAYCPLPNASNVFAYRPLPIPS